MSLIQNLTRGALGIRADVSGTPAAWDDYWYKPLGFSSAAGVRVDAESAKRCAMVLACVSVKSKNIGMMPCKIYTGAPDGSTRLVPSHPLYDVLYDRPNSQQTAYEFKQMLQAHVELRGNAYAEIKPGPRGAVDQLVPMHPDRVRVERMLPSGKLRYRYDDPLTHATRNLMQEEVFHLRNFSDDGAVGQSTVSMAVDMIGVALAQQDYRARFLRNDARPPIVFEGAAFKTKQQEEDFLESWQRRHTAANRGKSGLLPPGITAKVLGVTPIDQQLMDSERMGDGRIAAIFGVPGHLVGITEKAATYKSVEQFNLIYAIHCILPILVMWEQAIQRDLITSPRYFAKFSMTSLLRADTETRYAAYHIALGDGWLCQDEVRAFEDMNPIAGGAGARYWRPANWSPLDQTSTPKSAITPERDPSDLGIENVDDAEGDGDQANDAGIREHLRMLAAAAADRCVRKETAALRKMVERGADAYQVEEFYSGQGDFVRQVLRLDPARAAEAQQGCFLRAGVIGDLLRAGDKGAAFDFIDKIAATESLKLADLVVGGYA